MLKLCLLLFLAIQYRNLVISRIWGWSPFLNLKVGSKVWLHNGVWFWSLPGTQRFLDLIRVCETMKCFITKIQEVSGTTLLRKNLTMVVYSVYRVYWLWRLTMTNSKEFMLNATNLYIVYSRYHFEALFIVQLQICLSIRI